LLLAQLLGGDRAPYTGILSRVEIEAASDMWSEWPWPMRIALARVTSAAL
jgi:hypothetical protein